MFWAAPMIIAGTAIGAGMLALPMISAGMWIYWSLLLMVLTWMLMLRASQAILEVNLHYEPGSSFHTLVQDTLGPVWSTINGLAPWPSSCIFWCMPMSAAAGPPCSRPSWR